MTLCDSGGWHGRSGPNAPYGTFSCWWVFLPWRLWSVHESTVASDAARRTSGEKTADAGLVSWSWSQTTVCDPHAFSGDQCGEQRAQTLSTAQRR